MTTPAPRKSRHGCLTAYLLFLIVTNGLSAIFLLLSLSKTNNPDGHPIGWKLVFIGLFSLGLIGSLALWRWQRWGFWLYLFCTFIWLAIDLAAGAKAVTILSLIAVVAVLYGALQVGRTNRGWTQLE